eukprot:TRINITY_DN108168_c0_g1_i1.p1 TRINITY_DN108168_c0_g1~~TRINITY_DN108168_c0_g1_i1.p1  ORF type:complete len:171 (+),score=24.45 TRINITY_DN108168_c0_g1_i1:67-579(+)
MLLRSVVVGLLLWHAHALVVSRRAFDLSEHMASSLSFEDVDPAADVIQGTLYIGKAAEEAGVVWYSVYFAKDGVRVGAPIQTLPKTGDDITVELGTPLPHARGRAAAALPMQGLHVPSGANQLMVVTSGLEGEMHKGVSWKLFDYVGTPLANIFQGFLSGGGDQLPVSLD